MANVSQLQPAIVPQVQSSSSRASEKDADFLALRLLNKRARLRLSPASHDLSSFPGKASLFAIVNSKGWFAAVTRDDSGASALILSPLADLRSALVAASADDEQSFQPQRRVPLNGATPHTLTFACNDTRILLGSLDGSIHVYASDQLLSSGEGTVQPIHVFATSSPATLLSIQPNPGDIPELVAVLRDCTNSPGSLAVELLDVQKLSSSGGWMAGGSPSTTPTSISWSPKGKQLALGLQSGDILTFSPSATATPKSSIPHPPSANNMGLISVHWLSTSSFHTIYAALGQLTPNVEQIHLHVSLDSKSNSAQDIKFSTPYLPYPGLRPPGEFFVFLRGWDPSKILLFIGDSTSSDIGLIGSVVDNSGERWHNFALEETSTPSLPLDKEQNDTILLGMDVDLTSTDSYHHSTASGEALDLPAHPIMYVYASDGTILGWHVLNVTGETYPGMISTSTPAPSMLSVPALPGSIVRELSSDMQTTPTTTSAFGQLSILGQTEPGFTQQPTSVFGKAPSFGESTVPTFGFGAFSSTEPAKFGQPTFGFGGPPQPPPTLPPSTSVPEETMASDDGPSLGGLGLGTQVSQDVDSKPSIFGETNAPVSSTQHSADGGLIQPATGFGAFAGFDEKSPFAKPSAFSGTQQPAATFGATALQSKFESVSSTAFGATSSFSTGQSVFSQAAPASTFGQPAFGQSSFQFQTGGAAFGKASFGAAPSPVSSVTSSAGGGFSAFASGTQTAFGVAASKNGSSAKPVWSASNSKPPEPSPLGTPELKAPVIPSQAVRDSITRDDDSRSPSPAPVQPKVTASSVFSSSVLGPSTGAFSNLQTTPSAFIKPASGVFGELPKDSPFFAPKSSELKPVSAFALSATLSTPTSTPPKTNFAQPAFGASSMPGVAFQSAFPAPAVTPAQPSPAPSGGAFSAFLGTSGGFTAFSSGGSKSFSDLLRSTEGDKPSTTELSEATPTKPAQAPPQPSVSTTPTTTPAKEPPKPPSPPPVTPGREEEPKTVEAKPSEVSAEPKEKAAEPIPIQEPSLESISSSTSSSFVKVSAGEEGEVTEQGEPSEPESPPEEEEEEEEGGDDDDDDEYEPSDASEEEESEEEDEYEVSEEELQALSETAKKQETREEAQKESELAESLLPATPAFTRSPSTTPKAEQPKITVSVSPPPQTPSPASIPRLSPVRDVSTTPPGTPVKETPPAPVQMPAPTLKAAPSASPFGLAPRTNNNRPIRSSPLASTPLVLDGEAESPPVVPKSAPPAIVAQPAAPKVPFGQWMPPPPPKSTDAGSTRPKTPPVFSFLPPSGEKPAPAGSAPATTPAPALPVFTPPEKVAAAISAPATTPSPSAPVFAFPTGFSPFTPSTTTPSTWGTPAKPAEVGLRPPTPKAPQTLFGGQSGLFGTKAASLSTSPFVSPIPSIVPSPSPTPPLPKTPVPATTPSPTPEQGMQAECLVLLKTLDKELENFKQLAAAASIKTEELKKTSGVNHQKSDLGVPGKWVFGDIVEYGKILVDVQADVKELKLQRVSLRKAMKELDSNMLKINTRKEEIIRFNKAQTDAEFAKMLKIRTLAPEYSETQSQLRRNIRAIRDRVQKLEDHLQSSKKRINEFRTGRPSIRPPTLDTVNRTFRNIDVAINQQKQDVSQLRYRMTKLEISGSVGTRHQVAVSSSRRPLTVTPNVAITTAAALNAERSAQKLKKAMLASRTQPLLNKMVVASSVPTSFQTPQKGTVVKLEAKTPDIKTPDGGFSLPTTPMMNFPSSLPSWTPSPPSFEFESPSSYDVTPSRNRSATKHHQKAVALKKSASPSGLAQSSVFEWQPVEPIKPASSLPFALRPAGSS